jgi:hypothetical protein
MSRRQQVLLHFSHLENIFVTPMECVKQAEDQFRGYCGLLEPYLFLHDLAAMAMSYLVTPYELFEENLLFRYHMTYKVVNRRPVAANLSSALDRQHPIVRRYLQRVCYRYGDDDDTYLIDALQSTLYIVSIPSSLCQRVDCYYSLGSRCTCTRPLFANDIQTGKRISHL